jgi:Methyltransferase domain
VMRQLKTAGKKLLHSLFVAGQRLGLNITPLHFYSSIPNLRRLTARTDWKKPYSMNGIMMRPVAEQLLLLERMMSQLSWKDNYDFYAKAIEQNGMPGYGMIESEVLAAFIASQDVARVLQIGCGLSTAVMLDSATKQNKALEVTCIEPFPNRYLLQMAQQGRIRLIPKIAQFVGLETYTQLIAGDLLFVDSTHTVAPGSEVNRIILEVLPQLRIGVWVHFHDIYFPYDYTREFLSSDLFFPQETALLYAFLLQNPNFAVELSMSVLHYSAAEQVKLLIPRYFPQNNDEGLAIPGGVHFPCSIYLRKIN